MIRFIHLLSLIKLKGYVHSAIAATITLVEQISSVSDGRDRSSVKLTAVRSLKVVSLAIVKQVKFTYLQDFCGVLEEKGGLHRADAKLGDPL